MSSTVHAGRPMATDDAGIVEAKACQLESWMQKDHHNTQYWAMPACNFTGNWEVAFGSAYINGSDDRQRLGALQGKTLFKPLETNSWGIGLAFGSRFELEGRISDRYALIPLSFSFRDDHLLVHTNLGWLYEQNLSRNLMTWSIGSEAKVSERTWASIETFGQQQGKPYYQLACRHWISPDRVQIDATYGDRIGYNNEHWYSIGLKLVSVPFLR